ncbi:phosphoribosylformylglycinamidine synthase [Candidatus Wirthbacteria bacterium CG2_30_54_11]|uniref:Phosphoribosylformylglycinamidine synthase n=1 Tax=Candidatus Wirthbacteria bacterium CG2_30_54_11 TaxID=1817892 RepID=A0A1J5IEM3_9BACT|nr:MAG: phosphoribosylformylglycinamidine synthase [Candidatus Wirthbacteria bacterium CG2_30_54_11]
MPAPRVIVLSGYGLNSEEETLQGFLHCGASGEIVHINDLIDGHKKLADYQIMAIPGGFSFGDDTGSGNAYANRMKNHLWDEVKMFMEKEHLVIGICNGAQILANLGLVPALDGKYGERQIALRHNRTARYECRWVDLKITPNHCVWTRGMDHLHVVVSHGEGNLYAEDSVLEQIKAKNLITATYCKADGTPANSEFPFNPNGALEDIAALTDESGRALLIMPHPERAMYWTQLDTWTLEKEQLIRAGKPFLVEADGMKIFRNAVGYFKE